MNTLDHELDTVADDDTLTMCDSLFGGSASSDALTSVMPRELDEPADRTPVKIAPEKTVLLKPPPLRRAPARLAVTQLLVAIEDPPPERADERIIALGIIIAAVLLGSACFLTF